MVMCPPRTRVPDLDVWTAPAPAGAREDDRLSRAVSFALSQSLSLARFLSLDAFSPRVSSRSRPIFSILQVIVPLVSTAFHPVAARFSSRVRPESPHLPPFTAPRAADIGFQDHTNTLACVWGNGNVQKKEMGR